VKYGLPYYPALHPSGTLLGMDAIVLRPLHHGERSPVLEVFAGLSERSRRLRFLGSKPRLLEREVDWLVDVGCCGREAVVAVDQETGATVGIARFVRDIDAPEAEIAFEVVDEWQGRGIGKRLVTELRSLALEQGILRFRALTAHGNQAAASLVRGLGDVLVHRYEDGAVELVVRIT
jgi:RimJ/RimL family protein N-acetyltransferase